MASEPPPGERADSPPSCHPKAGGPLCVVAGDRSDRRAHPRRNGLGWRGPRGSNWKVTPEPTALTRGSMRMTTGGNRLRWYSTFPPVDSGQRAVQVAIAAEY